MLNCIGSALSPVATVSLYTTLVSFLVIIVTTVSVAETHGRASFVFTTFLNDTGWSQDGIAFINGLVNVNLGFSCLDTAVHMAEEVFEPERLIPIAIMGTVGIGFVTSFGFIIAMLFSLADIKLVSGTETGAPILELFYQALRSKPGAIALECLVICTGVGCLAACHTWQSRLCWSFASDGGISGSKYLARIHPTLQVPLNAHAASCILTSGLGCLYLASTTAFNR